MGARFNKIFEGYIKLLIKHFFVYAVLSVLRGFVFIKQNLRSIVGVGFKPAIIIGRFLFRFIGLPGYRLIFFLHRQFFRFYLPAKNKFFFLFTNRLILHAVVAGLVVLTGVVNVQASEVRGEFYGSNNLLTNLINPDEANALEEVSASEAIINLGSTSYFDSFVVSSEAIGADETYLLDETSVTTVFGGGALVVPVITQPQASVAQRTEVETYVVQEGDVLGSIAEKFGLKLNTVLWANNLTYRSTIKPGQELTILPVDGVTYKAKNGDTISGIVKKYGSSEEKILAFNNLSDPSDLQIGQTLILPDAEPLKTATVRYTAPVSKIFTGGSSSPSVATGSWTWPTDGCYITVYFNQYYRYGLHKGLDIDGDYTSNIYASRAGTITRASYFGNYGNCVEIDHGDGYITRYGHLSKFGVSAGDVIGDGVFLGKMGTSGLSTGTHLHFEIMDGKTKVNPLNFIRCPK